MHRSASTALLAFVIFFALPSPSAGQGCTRPPLGMVSWWPADGESLDIAGDNHGTLVNGATFAMGRVEEAFSVTGGAYVEVPDDPSLDLNTTITLDAWINATAHGGRVVDKITAGGADGYLLDTFGSRVRLIIDGISLSGSTALPTDTWIHIAGTYDGTTMRVYVDGVLDNSTAFAGAIPTNDLSLRIGADSTGASAFDGLIDEVEVLDRALSDSEIQDIVAAGSLGKCKVAPIPVLSMPGIAVMVLLLIAASFLVQRQRLS